RYISSFTNILVNEYIVVTLRFRPIAAPPKGPEGEGGRGCLGRRACCRTWPIDCQIQARRPSGLWAADAALRLRFRPVDELRLVFAPRQRAVGRKHNFRIDEKCLPDAAADP